MRVNGPKVNYCTVTVRGIVTSSSSRPKEDVDYVERAYAKFPSSSEAPTRVNPSLIMGPGTLRVCVLSDSHEEHERLGYLPPCDILVHAGDILMKSRKYNVDQCLNRLRAFNEWIGRQTATYKIVIGGNHDIALLNMTAPNPGPEYKDHTEYVQREIFTNAIYLCNSTVKLYNDTFTVVGSPMSIGQGSNNSAFQDRMFMKHTYAFFQALAAEKTRVDLLITHGPLDDIGRMIQPTMAHVYGHIHEHYGVTKVFHRLGEGGSSSHLVEYKMKLIQSLKSNMITDSVDGCDTPDNGVGLTVNQEKFICWHRVAASIMNEDFEPVQLPMIMEFSVK